jgi:hypothetical protein
VWSKELNTNENLKGKSENKKGKTTINLQTGFVVNDFSSDSMQSAGESW